MIYSSFDEQLVRWNFNYVVSTFYASESELEN